MHPQPSLPLSISIVVPSYNHRPWISACINSILIQKTEQDQLIVVDGNSNDGTKEILKSHSSSIDNLIVEPDNGQSDALHKGFSLATGDILAYLNSDDILLPETFSFIRKFFLQHKNVDAVYSNRVYIDQNGKPIGRWIIPFHSSYCHKRWDYIPQETCFWRKALMDKSGSIDTTLQFAMDCDLFVRMMDVGKFRHVHRYLACFRDHPGTKTNTIYETTGKEEIHRIMEKYGIKTAAYDRLAGNIYGQLILRLGQLAQVTGNLTRHKRLVSRIVAAEKCGN